MHAPDPPDGVHAPHSYPYTLHRSIGQSSSYLGGTRFDVSLTSGTRAMLVREGDAVDRRGPTPARPHVFYHAVNGTWWGSLSFRPQSTESRGIYPPTNPKLDTCGQRPTTV